ncbi:MAG: DNA topoisomerase VI subunit B, partial [Candidatus Lokiarchaeota archaeon]|nr:DNA topoisomerase VI subunit B [Candidatus Lokiarchaeota archaeon]
MRKRTQLVGFEYGYWKHVQYCAEFTDNALDAIESFQWKELRKPNSKIKFSLDQELFLEKFSIVEAANEEKKTQQLNSEAKHTLMQELGIETSRSEETAILKPEEKDEESGEISDQAELEVEEEVKRIIDDMQEIIKPVENIIDVEPIFIVRIREFEAASFLTSEISQKNVMSFTFEIFDNGTGMSKIDLRKFGKYLASSKSMELKQTRGSQGFGSPSAFSDAQNTTGKPIVAVSKTADNIYATVSEFFTTSKNEKKYLIHPTEIDSPFLHGTYVKLNYLNVKYVKGYVEKYIEETAYMNPHITIIYIDPYGKEKIYRRLASYFPKEPKYAKPHPSSANIGDLQDLISKSENKSISSFLKENFVRISSKTANEIINMAERNLQDKFNLLILKEGFVSKIKKKEEKIHYLKFEKRIFGRSTKPRDKLIIYEVNSEDLAENYWMLISEYNQGDKSQEKINKEIRKINNRIEKVETQKETKKLEKDIKNLIKDIDGILKEKEKIRESLDKLFQSNMNGLIELKKLTNRNDFEDLIREVQLSKIKPSDITKEQFNSLFLAFKSIKYMAPPTDTAIPVGESILENTLIKEIGLRVSEGVDDFDTPIETINQTIDIIYEDKKNLLINEDPKVDSEIINNISVDSEEIINLNSDILRNINEIDENFEDQQIMQSIDELLTYSEVEPIENYDNVFEFFIENYTKDDDFVSAETRAPTSGKGLAYVVEAVLAYSRNIEVPKRSRDVLSRFVNRTPKLRDSADCAITKAVQSVNWKNYSLESYDNGLPKGPIKLLVNVSGPFVHLMFKSQSKNALADDEDLIKEMKYCLEAIGRRLRVYINRRASIHRSEKRSSLIEKYIPLFVQSVYNIASKGESKFKAKLDRKEIETLMKEAIGKKPAPTIIRDLEPEKPEIAEVKEIKKIEDIKEEISEIEPEKKEKPIEKDFISKKTLHNWTVKELKDYCNSKNIDILSKAKKEDIIEKILDSHRAQEITKKPEIEPQIKIEKPEPTVQITRKVESKTFKPPVKKVPKKPATKPTTSKPKSTQTTLPVITTDGILKALSN